MNDSLVNEVFALEEYVDRCKRLWKRVNEDRLWVSQSTEKILTDEAIKMLIARDAHRDECPGLYKCSNHPVPVVWQSRFSHRFKTSNSNYSFEKISAAFRRASETHTRQNFKKTAPYEDEKMTRIFSEYIPHNVLPAMVI